MKSIEVKDGDGGFEEFFSSYGEDKSEFELILFVDKFKSNELLLYEVVSFEGVDIFIDYRKKRGTYIISILKFLFDFDKNVFCREDRVGKMNFDKFDEV